MDMLDIADPLHRATKKNRVLAYGLLAVFFARLAFWHGIEHVWGKA